MSETQHETKIPSHESWEQRGYNAIASGSEDKPPLPREVGLTIPIWTTPPETSTADAASTATEN
jgi:hypothetical protein